MRAHAFLNDLRHAPVVPPERLFGEGAIAILSPHPDDESLGCGGLIMAALSLGRRVEVMILTDGAGSHPGSKSYPPERLRATRRDESRHAAERLGLSPSRLTYLGLEDTNVPIAGPLFEQTVETLDQRFVAEQIKTVFVTWRIDPHCDHEAASAIAHAVTRRHHDIRLWSYPIWSWHLGPDATVDDVPRGVRLDISPWQRAKRAAIQCHHSQMTDLIDDDPHGFRFTEETLAPFIGPFEYFLEAAS